MVKAPVYFLIGDDTMLITGQVKFKGGAPLLLALLSVLKRSRMAAVPSPALSLFSLVIFLFSIYII